MSVAALGIKLTDRELRNLAKAWVKAPDMVRDELVAATWQAVMLLEREVKERTPVGATSLLRESITAFPPEVSIDGVTGIVGTSVAHATPVELGTRPHFPPIAPLMDWVQAKLDINNEKEARHVAFLIARKIAAKGTEGARMFGDSLEANEGQIHDMYRLAAGRIATNLGNLH